MGRPARRFAASRDVQLDVARTGRKGGRLRRRSRWRWGCEAGERVGIWSPNNAEWIVTQYATAKAGLILVNINPAYRLSELDYALNKVGCRALVTATRFKTSDYIGMVNTLAPELAEAAPGHLRRRKCRRCAR